MFSKNWEKVYKKKKQISSWPWSDLITLISRHVLNRKKINNVLELGTGAGANIRFFLEKKIDYYGIEGSLSATKLIKKKHPMLKAKIFNGDFTKKLFTQKKFDLIIDRGSLTHNNHDTIKKTLKLVKNSLKKDGYLICVDWFSKKDSAWKNAKSKNKKYHSIKNIKKGDLKNVGTTHFVSYDLIRKMTKGWELIHCEEKIKKTLYPHNREQRAVYSFVLRK